MTTMTDEVKAALARYHAGDGDCQSTDDTILANAFAALHPVDDDEPLSLEWFVQNYPHYEQLEMDYDDKLQLFYSDKLPCGRLSFVTDGSCHYEVDSGYFCVKKCKTRGQLRRLLAVLKEE
jgi:hypothetical protein